MSPICIYCFEHCFDFVSHWKFDCKEIPKKDLEDLLPSKDIKNV